MCTINKSAHTKKGWKLIICTSYHILEVIRVNWYDALNCAYSKNSMKRLAKTLLKARTMLYFTYGGKEKTNTG